MYRLREVDGAEYVEELTELHKATFDGGEVVADVLDGYWWGAFYDDVSVAFIGIKQSILGPHVGYFWRVGVLPQHRGNALQRRLMRAMEAKAKKLGWLRIVTDTRDNPHSANNIISAGYRMFSPAAPWAHHDACYWTKALTNERQQRSRAPRRRPAGGGILRRPRHNRYA